MLPTSVWVEGYRTYSPNHLIKRLNIDAPHLVGLYLWFIDAVVSHKGKEPKVEIFIMKCKCPTCGEYEREEPELDAGLFKCPKCQRPPQDGDIIGSRYRGSVLWGQPISYKDIGESVGKGWRTIQSQVQELVALGYIEAKRPNKFVPFSFYVADSWKYRITRDAVPAEGGGFTSAPTPMTPEEEAAAALDAQADKAFADDAPDVEPTASPSLSDAWKAFEEVEE